jgi:hypothetical protein
MTDNPVTRRTAILAAGAAAAGAALPAAAPGRASNDLAFSPEYLACHAAWIDCERAKETQTRFEVSDAEAAFEISAIERWRVAKEALLARPLRGLIDVLAVVRTNAWQQGHFVRTQDWAVDGDEIRTLRAVEALVGAEPWHVPTDLIAADDEMRAEKAARRRVERWDQVFDDSVLSGAPLRATFNDDIIV